MMVHPYDFSIIMAVYNVEEYLYETIQSLLDQTLSFKEHVQLILIDDGSSDNSGFICDEYAKLYAENIIVIHKENGGVASARNEGLKYASGKYLNFMDSDDKFSRDALEKVLHFFSKYEDEIDVATIPLRFFDGRKGEHWQNQKFKSGSRIINLWKEYASPLMFVNASFFRYECKQHILFDPHLVCGEDIKVLLKILSLKMRMGVISNTYYLYRRRSGENESLIQTSKKKYGWYFDYFTYLVDWARDYFLDLYGAIPLHVQYTICCDLQWRFKEDYQREMSKVLTQNEIERYKEILYRSLAWIDDSIIMQQRMIWQEQKIFMLRKKHSLDVRYDYLANEKDAALYVANTQVCKVSQGLTYFEFITVTDSTILLEGYSKFVNLTPADPISISCILFDQNNRDTLEIPCEVFPRTEHDSYALDELIFYSVGFKCVLPINSLKKTNHLRLSCCIKGMSIIKKAIRFGKLLPLSEKHENSYYLEKNWVIKRESYGLSITKNATASFVANEYKFCRELWKCNSKGSRKAILVRVLSHLLKWLKQKPIVIISDRINKADDNGEALFLYIIENKPSDIHTYFILDQNATDYLRLKKAGHIVPYQSIKHKLLMLISDYVVSSQMDEYVINPFGKYNIYYRDFLYHFKYIFLQHGVTKDDLSHWLNRYRMNIKGFITSGRQEYESIINGTYYYTPKEVWLTGMPRYDRLCDNREKIILIMPTWRAWLLGRYHQDIGVREGDEKLFHSEYICFYNQLVNHKRLLKALQEYNYTISLVLHPYISRFYDKKYGGIRTAQELFDTNDFLTIEPLDKPYRELFAVGSLLVTDYSSVAFDFSYLRKPVIYAHFDSDVFFSGEHTVLPGYFDYAADGFGEIEYTLEGTVNRIIEYIQRDCQLKTMYRDRINHFFAYEDNKNCERVLQKIIEDI